jgi:murein DD-endopeptidase MepM/ murein hydrolase activator NlpD
MLDGVLVTQNRRSRRKRGEILRVSIGLGSVFAVLVGLNLYVFLFGRGTSIRDVLQSSVILPSRGDVPAGPGAAPAAPETPPPAEEIKLIQGELRRGDKLGPVLRREGVTPAEVEMLMRALRPEFDPRNVLAGQVYRIEMDATSASVFAFDLVVSPVETLRIERGASGFEVTRRSKQLATEVVALGGVIERSLHEAVEALGEDTSLISFFVDAFSWDIDFYVDQHPGDRFKVVVEKRMLDGEFYQWGRVLAAEYDGRVGTYRVFAHQGADGRPRYFDERGRSAQKSVLKSPLKYVRITSRFGRRFHPVLHRAKGHMGVDFAAPTGTPVRATADGRVTFVGAQRGSGNMIVLSHAGGITSLYMHLSRFARGLRAGQPVDQRQVIGYVGSTGMSTGPHLHFGLKKDGRYIDPLRHRGEPGRGVPASELAAFKKNIAPHQAALAVLDPQRPQRQAARGLTVLR